MKLKLKTCDNCQHEIEVGLLQPIVHLTCKECGTKYQLDKPSRQKYLVITPLVIVALIIVNRLFLNLTDISLLMLLILIGSYVIAHTINLLMIKYHGFNYEIDA